jgi:hypothetical protein
MKIELKRKEVKPPPATVTITMTLNEASGVLNGLNDFNVVDNTYPRSPLYKLWTLLDGKVISE